MAKLSSLLPSQIIPFDVECIRNMLHGCAWNGIILDQHDIKAARSIFDPMLSKILCRQPD